MGFALDDTKQFSFQKKKKAPVFPSPPPNTLKGKVIPPYNAPQDPLPPPITLNPNKKVPNILTPNPSAITNYFPSIPYHTNHSQQITTTLKPQLRTSTGSNSKTLENYTQQQRQQQQQKQQQATIPPPPSPNIIRIIKNIPGYPRPDPKTGQKNHSPTTTDPPQYHNQRRHSPSSSTASRNYVIKFVKKEPQPENPTQTKELKKEPPISLPQTPITTRYRPPPYFKNVKKIAPKPKPRKTQKPPPIEIISPPPLEPQQKQPEKQTETSSSKKSKVTITTPTRQTATPTPTKHRSPAAAGGGAAAHAKQTRPVDVKNKDPTPTPAPTKLRSQTVPILSAADDKSVLIYPARSISFKQMKSVSGMNLAGTRRTRTDKSDKMALSLPELPPVPNIQMVSLVTEQELRTQRDSVEAADKKRRILVTSHIGTDTYRDSLRQSAKQDLYNAFKRSKIAKLRQSPAYIVWPDRPVVESAVIGVDDVINEEEGGAVKLSVNLSWISEKPTPSKKPGGGSGRKHDAVKSPSKTRDTTAGGAALTSAQELRKADDLFFPPLSRDRESSTRRVRSSQNSHTMSAISSESRRLSSFSTEHKSFTSDRRSVTSGRRSATSDTLDSNIHSSRGRKHSCESTTTDATHGEVSMSTSTTRRRDRLKKRLQLLGSGGGGDKREEKEEEEEEEEEEVDREDIKLKKPHSNASFWSTAVGSLRIDSLHIGAPRRDPYQSAWTRDQRRCFFTSGFVPHHRRLFLPQINNNTKPLKYSVSRSNSATLQKS